MRRSAMPRKSASAPIGQLERRDARAEPVAQLVEGALEAGPLAVELVDEDHAGHVEPRRLPPDRPRSAPRRRRPRSPRTPPGRPPAAPPARRRGSRRSPGVSIRLTLWPFHSNGVTARDSEMPRRCSSGSWSLTVVPSSHAPQPVDGAGSVQERLGQRGLAGALRGPPGPRCGSSRTKRAALGSPSLSTAASARQGSHGS